MALSIACASRCRSALPTEGLCRLNAVLAIIWLSARSLPPKRCSPLTIATGLGAVGFHPKFRHSSPANAFSAQPNACRPVSSRLDTYYFPRRALNPLCFGQNMVDFVSLLDYQSLFTATLSSSFVDIYVAVLKFTKIACRNFSTGRILSSAAVVFPTFTLRFGWNSNHFSLCFLPFLLSRLPSLYS
jgi:hypothetical protein